MTSENLESCDFTKDYFEFRKVLFLSSEPVRHLLCGSFYEIPLLYYFSNPTDTDTMYCDMTLCAIYDHVNVPARCSRNVLTIDATDCHVGFVRLRNGVEYFRKPYDFDKGPSCVNEEIIEDTTFRSILGQINTRWGDTFMFSRDRVYALSCPLWPPDAHDWITRKRINGWPSEENINAIVNSGCHLVFKPHGKNPNDDTQWRYSFSQAETILIHNSWTEVQKYIYHLLRVIKRDVVSKCGGEDESFISSYYFKTLMLWACEEKPSEFWEDRNIVTSVRELLLDLIEKLIDRNVPHYFMPANNMMDVLPCNTDVDNEIRLLLSYREEEILEITGKEPKAYKMEPLFFILSSQSLILLAAKLTYLSTNIISDRQLRESRILSICSSKYFYTELQYLLKGIKTHLELLKLNSDEDRIRRQNVITSAEDFFDLSTKKMGYDFTRIRFEFNWSVFELSQQLLFLGRNKHFPDQISMIYAGSCAPRTTSTSCYIRDRNDYVRDHCSFSQSKMKTRVFPILQGIFFSEVSLPLNPTHVVCSAYRVNFVFNALCDYRKAVDICEEVNQRMNSSVTRVNLLFADTISFPLINEWSGLYDKYIQIVLGFLTLHRTLTAATTARKRMIPVNICSVQYLRYIYTRCCRILNEPVAGFGFDDERLRQYKIFILKYTASFSKAILRTALHISKPDLVHL